MAGIQQQHWQPQGRDTTNGPINHIYIPRSDGMVGGQPAAPQPGGYYIPVITNLGPPGPPGGGGGGGGVGGGGGGSGGYPFPVDTVPVEIKPGGEINTMVPPNNAPAPGPALQPAVPLVYQQPYPIYQAAPAQALPAPQNNGYLHYQNMPGVPNYPNAIVHPQGTHPNGNHYTNHVQQQAMNYNGLTGGEVYHRQMATAYGLNMHEPQDIKPADPDQFRMYWVRDQDGTYVQHNLLTIESGDIGDVRWYIADGVYYAVKLNAN